MKVLSIDEVEDSVELSRRMPESQLIPILDELEKEHPGVYRIIYGEPSKAIAAVNRDMANLYLDMSFDVVWVFRHQFGKPPMLRDEERWVSSQVSLLDAELKSLAKDSPMDNKIRSRLQSRFANRNIESMIQMGLLEYLDSRIINYVEFDKRRAAASQLTSNMMFVLVSLMSNLYSLQAAESS